MHRSRGGRCLPRSWRGRELALLGGTPETSGRTSSRKIWSGGRGQYGRPGYGVGSGWPAAGGRKQASA